METTRWSEKGQEEMDFVEGKLRTMGGSWSMLAPPVLKEKFVATTVSNDTCGPQAGKECLYMTRV